MQVALRRPLTQPPQRQHRACLTPWVGSGQASLPPLVGQARSLKAVPLEASPCRAWTVATPPPGTCLGDPWAAPPPLGALAPSPRQATWDAPAWQVRRPNTVNATSSSGFWLPHNSLPHLWPSQACPCTTIAQDQESDRRLHTLPPPCFPVNALHGLQPSTSGKSSLIAWPCAHFLMEACGFGGIQPAQT